MLHFTLRFILRPESMRKILYYIIKYARVHTEKSFRNLTKLNRNQILFTIFRLIYQTARTKRMSVWFQINQKMVSTI